MQIKNILSLDSNKMAECNVCMHIVIIETCFIHYQLFRFVTWFRQVGPVVHIKSTTTRSVVSIRSVARSIIRCVKQCRYHHCDWTNGVRGASTTRIMSNMLTILQTQWLTKVFSHTSIFYYINRIDPNICNLRDHFYINYTLNMVLLLIFINIITVY